MGSGVLPSPLVCRSSCQVMLATHAPLDELLVAAADAFAGNALVHHQSNFNSPVLGAAFLSLVFCDWFQLPVTERLDQAVQRHLVLADDVINNRVRSALAQI